ncbi:type II secretion system F family protein [Pigmentiphaga soli]|uniref:Type II secretion system F family protein n=1 Tax=Pigmentiphaga soli TaxID=1007095 RepID=A0ABP8H5Q3_9BURK
MNPAILAMACVALLLAAGGVWLWQDAVTRGRRQATQAFVERQLGSTVQAAAAESEHRWMLQARPARGLAGRWNNLLLRAGVDAGPRFYLPLAAALVALPLAVWLLSGPLGAVVALLLAVAAAAFHLWLKADKRRRKMVKQLPGFIDALVRLVTIGNALGSAFHTAAPLAEAPLLEVLERANQLHRAGMELDQALFHAARLYRIQELELVGAVIGVALRFGGRSDMVLERMAGFMRDLQQAREELHAMSAEVRLSAWILALLPVGVAGFIIIFNNALFMGMWNDTTGRAMLLGAVLLQLAGSYWLYRMAKSV